MFSTLKRIPRRVYGVLYGLLIILFLALFIKGTSFSQLGHLHFSWMTMLASVVVGLAFRYWAVFIWRVILYALGSKKLPPYGVMGYVFAQAWLARYIPGTVTMVAGKIFMASKYGISKTKLAVSSLLEGAMQIIAMSIVSLLLIGVSPHVRAIPAVVRIIAVVISVSLLTILIPRVFNYCMERLYLMVKKKKHESDELHINGKAVVRSFLLFAVGTFLSGTANFLVIQAIIPNISWHEYTYIVGAFGLAGAIGIAVPFVPSGLGIKDGVQLVLLVAIMPRSEALLIIVVSRIWQVLVDGAFMGVAALIYHARRKQYDEIIARLGT